ncbi:DUF3891 family protein [Oceanobacillus halotolerans]|uniref:DUF3891 family protein n=1 Tax=Oceanobacillus halotolerans TaxID=2663380 RepID=UPI0013D9FAC5|nr:DUF3891 family protein [Oceanobacillus halotolerans]
MIVRENEDVFTLIEQHRHGMIAGHIAFNWREDIFPGIAHRESVLYAVTNHDYGWKPIDEQPFWNDKKQMPYMFMDFPLLPRLVFYRYGIDQVARHDAYAGLLCSRHYVQFLINDETSEVHEFIRYEERRQAQLKKKVPNFDSALFDAHYGFLQLCDNLSLYICLNDPGVPKDKEHSFFRNGVPIPPALDTLKQTKLQPEWKDLQTIIMDQFVFQHPITIPIKQKKIHKHKIQEKGFLNTYQETPTQIMNVSLVPA